MSLLNRQCLSLTALPLLLGLCGCEDTKLEQKWYALGFQVASTAFTDDRDYLLNSDNNPDEIMDAGGRAEVEPFTPLLLMAAPPSGYNLPKDESGRKRCKDALYFGTYVVCRVHDDLVGEAESEKWDFSLAVLSNMPTNYVEKLALRFRFDELEARIIAGKRDLLHQLRQNGPELMAEGWKLYRELRKDIHKSGWDEFDKSRIRFKWALRTTQQ